MHLFLHGESGAGKSYAISSALKSLQIETKGFTTQRIIRAGDRSRVEIRYAGKRSTVAEGVPGNFKAYPERFDEAAEALDDICAGDVVLMDELGFLERNAKRFQNKVLETLQKPCRVIGVCKDEDIPFMRAIRELPAVRTMPVSVQTRQESFRIVREFMRPRTLCEALGVGIGITAIIGGGGKTSLCEALGRELAAEDRVALTTTTHIGMPVRLPWVQNAEELQRMLETHNPVWIAAPTKEHKLGAPVESMNSLLGCCDCLIVEADGSKQLPLKAHAAHEPVLPENAHVISVIGADAFGKPISEVVHRPELFAKAVGAGLNDIVSGEMAAMAAKRAGTVLINKTETAEQLKEARAFAAARPHKRTVIASLQSKRPVIEIWEGELCVW